MKPKSGTIESFDKKTRDQGQNDSISDTIESFDKKARDQGQNDFDSDTIRTPRSTIHLKQVSSFYIFFCL